MCQCVAEPNVAATVCEALLFREQIMNTRKVAAAIVTATLALTAAACNTVSGAGEDLQSASDEVEEEM